MSTEIYNRLNATLWQPVRDKYKQPLNGIETARLFSLLLMDILSDSYQFKLFTDFDHEQDYYAQVADGKQYRIPRSSGEKIIHAMGISNTGQLRHFRRLLRLPQIVWTVADDLNWSESFIQKHIITTDDTETIINAMHYAISENHPEETFISHLHLIENEKIEMLTSGNDFSYNQFYKKFGRKIYNLIQAMSEEDKQQSIAHLEKMIERLKSE